jgi:hypothetical protein
MVAWISCRGSHRQFLDGPHPDPQLLNGLATGIELGGLVETEAIIEQGQAGLGARLFALGAHDHGGQPHAVGFFGGGHQTVAGGLGMARLDAIDGGVLPQEAVAVVLLDTVVHEFFSEYQA